VAFCAAYYVDDIEVFFIPAHLIAALLLGEGVMALRRLTTDHRPPTTGETRDSEARDSGTGDQRPETGAARLVSRVSCLQVWGYVIRHLSVVGRRSSVVTRFATAITAQVAAIITIAIATNWASQPDIGRSRTWCII